MSNTEEKEEFETLPDCIFCLSPLGHHIIKCSVCDTYSHPKCFRNYVVHLLMEHPSMPDQSQIPCVTCRVGIWSMMENSHNITTLIPLAISGEEQSTERPDRNDRSNPVCILMTCFMGTILFFILGIGTAFLLINL